VVTEGLDFGDYYPAAGTSAWKKLRSDDALFRMKLDDKKGVEVSALGFTAFVQETES